MNGRLRVVALCAALTILVAGVPAGAQAPAPPGSPRILTLTDALRRTLEQNPQLRVAAFEVTVARIQLQQARAGQAVAGSLQGSYTRTQEGGSTTIFCDGGPPPPCTITLPPPSPNLYDARLVLQYPLYTGGRIEAQIALAEANVKGAEATLERIRQQIIFGVRQAYYQLLLAQAGLASAERGVTQAAESLRIARARVTAGVSPRFDEVQAQVAVAGARQALVRSRNAVAQATQALNALLNLPLDAPLVPADPFAIRPVAQPLDQLLAQALDKRPELAELRARQAAAQAGVQLAESGAKPNLALSGAYMYSNTTGIVAGTSGSTNWSVTLAVTLNLFDGGLTGDRVQEARTRLDQLKAMEAQQRQTVELEARQAYLNLQSAREEQVGADALLLQAQEALRIANVRFEAGVGTSLEVLTAQASLSEAEAAKAQAQFNYSTARAALERAVGDVLP